MAEPKIKVPANLIPTIRDAANYYGIPFSVLAGTIQLGTSWTNSVDDQFVADVANAMAKAAPGADRNPYSGSDPLGASWIDAAAAAFGGGARSGFRSRLGALVQEDASDLNDEERWTYDKENPAPASSYSTPAFGGIAERRVTIGKAVAVPENIQPILRAAADRAAKANGVDPNELYNVLAGVLNRESGMRPIGPGSDNVNADGSRDRGIAQINASAHPDVSDEQAYDPQFAINWAADYLASRYTAVDGTGQQRWVNAAAAYNAGLGGYKGEVGQAYGNAVVDASMGGGVGIGPKVSYTAGATKRTPIEEARRFADSISLNLLGRVLSDAELGAVVKNGWNPDQLEQYLRSQKYGNTDTTVGAATDVRRAIMDAWRKAGLPDPTEGQINFAIVNHIPAADADAYAEQTKSKTVWATDPTTYTTTRDAIRQVMASYGIVVAAKDIDANLVNAAATGKWTVDQMKQAVASKQYPGAPPGTTVDHYVTTKDLADKVWGTYFPTSTMPDTYVKQFLGMTPDQISAFVRALPSEEAKAAGVIVPVGIYNDAKNTAKQALARLGVVGRDPTAAEVASFASSKGGTDAEAILKHYATDASVLAINPGAQYGMSREDYYRNRSAIESGFNDRFGGVDAATLATDKSKAANPTIGAAPAEPDWLKEVFKEGYTPQQSASIFDDYFKRTGAAPSATDIDMFKTRSTTQYSDFAVKPGGDLSTGKPTLPGLNDQARRGYA